MRSFKTSSASCLAAFGLFAAMFAATVAWGQGGAPAPGDERPAAPKAGAAAPAGAVRYEKRLVYTDGEREIGRIVPVWQADDDLDRQSDELISKYVDAKQDADREKIKAELLELLAKQFDIQQQIREDEVAQIEARVKKLRELIEKRKAAQQSIIERRLKQLLRDAEGLGWAPTHEGPQPRFIRAGGYRGQGAWAPVELQVSPADIAK